MFKSFSHTAHHYPTGYEHVPIQLCISYEGQSPDSAHGVHP
jgi:hypothetical protein